MIIRVFEKVYVDLLSFAVTVLVLQARTTRTWIVTSYVRHCAHGLALHGILSVGTGMDGLHSTEVGTLALVSCCTELWREWWRRNGTRRSIFALILSHGCHLALSSGLLHLLSLGSGSLLLCNLFWSRLGQVKLSTHQHRNGL